MKKKIVISLYSLCLCATVFAILLVAGCSGGETSSTSGGSGVGAPQTVDLASTGLTPDPAWHDSYLTGSHSGYDCSACHTTTARSASSSAERDVSGDQICYQCHADKYNNTAIFNHGQNNTGTHCNSCHYSDSFTSHTRIGAGAYHSAVTGSCESCHAGRAPSSHSSDGRTSNCANCHQYSNGSWSIAGAGAHTHTSGCVACHSARAPANHYGTTCENCHSYPSWSGATFIHTNIVSGCASCHSWHYTGYACQWCHTFGITWSFSHARVTAEACSACHDSNGGGDNEGGGEHEGGGHEGGEHEGGGDD